MTTSLATTARRLGRKLMPEMDPFVRASLFSGLATSPAPTPTTASAAAVVSAGISELGIALAHNAPEAQSLLRAHARSQALETLRLEAGTPAIFAVLAKAGVEVLLIKGAGLRTAHPLLAERGFSDVDVLVPPEAIPAAIAALEDNGFTEARERWQPRRTFRIRLEHAIPMRGTRGADLDVHHAIPPRYWGRTFTLEHFSIDPREVASGVRAPSVEHSAFLAALHIVHNAGQCFRPWRDAAALLWDQDALERIIPHTIEHALATPVYAVMFGLGTALGAPPRATALLEPHLRADHVARLRVILGGKRLGSHHARYALGLPTRDGLRFAAEYLWPDSDFLQERFGKRSIGARLAWWRDSVTRARRER